MGSVFPPSFRFPPLREGNRARVRFPLLAGGTCRRGFGLCPRCARGTALGTGSVFPPSLRFPPLREGNRVGVGFGLCPRFARGTEWGLGSVFSPSLRFPPLREGNRERHAYSVPPACRGNLKEGVINCCFL